MQTSCSRRDVKIRVRRDGGAEAWLTYPDREPRGFLGSSCRSRLLATPFVFQTPRPFVGFVGAATTAARASAGGRNGTTCLNVVGMGRMGKRTAGRNWERACGATTAARASAGGTNGTTCLNVVSKGRMGRRTAGRNWERACGAICRSATSATNIGGGADVS